ncbi:MAG: hypothetical protein KDA33_15590 [Phycisphaerales bacterium]|nr:hypothetical protein [Phycisphaerales bacterium]
MIDHDFISSCMWAMGAPLELAYVGPGGGLAAIGALLAVVAGLFAAVFGFLWYPIKRMLRRKDKSSAPRHEGNIT